MGIDLFKCGDLEHKINAKEVNAVLARDYISPFELDMLPQCKDMNYHCNVLLPK